MTIALWIAASVLMYLAPGYLGGRYIYFKRRKSNNRNSSGYSNDFGPVAAGFWLMMCGPFGGLAGLITWMIDNIDRGSYGMWDKFFNYKGSK